MIRERAWPPYVWSLALDGHIYDMAVFAKETIRAEVYNAEIFTSAPPVHLHGLMFRHRYNFTFTLVLHLNISVEMN